jgi:hypothetical protein
MTYTLTVLDRGRPIARHINLTIDESKEIAAAYRAIGWPEEKVVLRHDEPVTEMPRAAA